MQPLVIAHRGASNLAPENTLAAFRTAKALGADGIEMDVQMTRDKHLVIAHDFVTDRVAGVHRDIFDADFDDLRTLDFGSWKSPEFAGEKIPTLEEVLEVGREMEMIQIELKPYFDRDKDFVDRVLDTVVSMGCEKNAVLTSFQYDLLRQVKERMPEMRTAALFLNMESCFCPPPALWTDLGLTNGDPLLDKLSGPQSAAAALSLMESGELEEENGFLYQYVRDRYLALLSNFPGQDLLEILQDYVHQIDTLGYVQQFDFPVDYIGPTYYGCFRDTSLIQRGSAAGFGMVPWPMFPESRRDLRSLVQMQPEIIVTNKPEELISILHGKNAVTSE